MFTWIIGTQLPIRKRNRWKVSKYFALFILRLEIVCVHESHVVHISNFCSFLWARKWIVRRTSKKQSKLPKDPWAKVKRTCFAQHTKLVHLSEALCYFAQIDFSFSIRRCQTPNHYSILWILIKTESEKWKYRNVDVYRIKIVDEKRILV